MQSPDPVAASTLRKVRRRILPYVFLLYIVAFLDRANVAFAKAPMSADLGFSEAAFGLGAGIFFIGYFLLEIPGALIVERYSARKWIARILITWGLCTVLIGFVRTPNEFYGARFLLGCAEAGFFPGIIVYLGHWFPRKERAKAVAGLILGVPVSQVLGGPLSALILHSLNWRWMFILEGIPAILLGFVTLRYLTDRPSQATWLSPPERDWLVNQLASESTASPQHASPWAAFRDRRILLLAISMACVNIGTYAFQLWVPSIIRAAELSMSAARASALAALPFAASILGMTLFGRSSDHTGERRFHTAIPMWFAGIFFFFAGRPNQSLEVEMLWLCLSGLFVYAWPGPFWTLPTAALGQTAAAASVGLINSVGNLGGFIGPTVIGYLLSAGYPMHTALAFIAAAFFLAGCLVLTVRVDDKIKPAT